MSPQFYANTLEPVETTPGSLQKTLTELLVAVRRGVDVVQQGSPPSEDWGSSGLYTGPAGIALGFLRLDHQSASLAEPGELSIDFGGIARERIPSHGPNIKLLPGRLSPVGSSSPLAAVVMRILAAASYGDKVNADDIELLREAVKAALQNGLLVPHGGRMMGGDEVLFGRAGLLWAILNIREHEFDEQTRASLQPIFNAVPNLIDTIVDAGRRGRTAYVEKHGSEDALPLMWTWMEGHYGLGLVHGLTGILAVLLACRPSELNDGTSRDYLPLLAGTVTRICEICIANGGHLPVAIPPRHSSSHRPSHLVQICHGAPGVLLLMACARRNRHLVSKFWEPTWDESIRLASERTWEEGLLQKGGSICHGISGNAWPWLLLHDSFEYDIDTIETAKRNYVERTQLTDKIYTEYELTGDYFLSRALAFLLHARDTPPYNMSSDTYRVPDHPFSLTEGLAGTVCAWADACVATQMKLRKIELTAQGSISEVALKRDSVFQELESRQLGFPTLAYHRPTGLL
ncbi:lanthionine synthetase C family protein [Aspergillus steynii IBT 23096]|uniref:Lanthionine synthetase C family protein n=1 Tax=Aspergillus steynii IBT 23096 TaxID=1392250 RepID=A0A2I2G216_9EURO|nr:lanthionine synthetase C family protein [Aspergillus steynii IBT 23096]PLB46911.1 lanthionine synthetase C family protein [Aspergillus steynii IBT 23096]